MTEVQPSLPRKEQAPRVVVQFDGLSETIREELLSIAKEYNWNLYDLRISGYNFPSSPSPRGAIICSPYGSPRPPHEGRTFEFPTVLLDYAGNSKATGYSKVIPGRRDAGRMAVDHFSAKGFQDIAIFLRRPWKSADETYHGVRERAAELGLIIHPFVLDHIKGEGEIKQQVRWKEFIGAAVSTLPKPLAFFASNDNLAARFCYDCQSYGLSVPEDVAVLGVNNNRFICETAPVPLSSIDMGEVTMARKAMEMLKRMINGENVSVAPIVIPPKEVIARRSTDMLAVSDQRVSRALRFMWDHLAWDLSIEEISMEVGVSRRTLTRLFSQCLGRSIIEELRRKRLEEAKELLKHTTLNVDEVSRKVGLPNPTYFYRSFRKAYNLTPAKFRAQYKSVAH